MTNYRDQFVVHWGGSKNAKLTLEIMPRATEHYFHYFLRLSGPKNLELFFEDIVGINVQPHWDRSQTSSLGGLKNFCYTVGSKGKVDTWSWFVSDSLNKNAFPTHNHLSDWSVSFWVSLFEERMKREPISLSVGVYECTEAGGIRNEPRLFVDLSVE